MISGAASELRAIALEATDASGYFPALYTRVTERVAAAISAGRFADGPRMDRFATNFASYYIDVRRGHRDAPRCWQASWDVGDDGRLLIVQHLLLGINAHVNHDLACAVVDAADERGDLASIRPDFDAINEVLATTYVGILDDLDRVSRWTNRVAQAGGGRAFNFSLRVARRQAWDAAVRMYPLAAPERRAYVTELDRLVAVLAYLVTQPSPLLRPVVAVLRRLEERDHASVIDSLLGSAGGAPA